MIKDSKLIKMRKGKNFKLGLLLFSLSVTSCSYRFHPSNCSGSLPGPLIKVQSIDAQVSESSGLLSLKGHFWTMNDSGGEAALYRLNPSSGQVEQKVQIPLAHNVDWEDLAMDQRYIYLADVGNNYGSRDTLVIYRIDRAELTTEADEVLELEKISYSYPEAAVAGPRGRSSLDCEALLAYRDSLWLFSKDWVEQGTSVYVIPALPGHHLAHKCAAYDVRFLVTGADLDAERQEVALVGYRDYMPVVTRYSFLQHPGRIACGGRSRVFPFRFGRQVEAICFQEGDLYITSERSLQKAALFRIRTKAP